MASPFNSSRGAMIHRCCTDHFIRAELPDKNGRCCISVFSSGKAKDSEVDIDLGVGGTAT
jgi:hypothetical protein